MLWQPLELPFADFFANLLKGYHRNLSLEMGWLGLITCHNCLRLTSVGNGTHTKKLFSGRSALIAIVITECSARFKGLAFFMGIPL